MLEWMVVQLLVGFLYGSSGMGGDDGIDGIGFYTCGVGVGVDDAGIGGVKLCVLCLNWW